MKIGNLVPCLGSIRRNAKTRCSTNTTHQASTTYFPTNPNFAKYIAFGDETGGGILLLELATGQIKLLAHDFQSEDRSLWIGEACSILYVANSFSDFRQKLLTEDEIDSDDFGQDWNDMEELRQSSSAVKVKKSGSILCTTPWLCDPVQPLTRPNHWSKYVFLIL